MEELNKIKKQFDELMERVEKIVKKNKKVEEKDEPKRWRAEDGEIYYCIGADLEPHIDYDDHIQADDIHFETNNYFRTEEEAKKVAQHFKDYLTLREDAKGFVPASDSVYYEVYYDYVVEELVVEELRTRQIATYIATDLAFETERDAIASIVEHKDVWLRYLGVTK